MTDGTLPLQELNSSFESKPNTRCAGRRSLCEKYFWLFIVNWTAIVGIPIYSTVFDVCLGTDRLVAFYIFPRNTYNMVRYNASHGKKPISFAIEKTSREDKASENVESTAIKEQHISACYTTCIDTCLDHGITYRFFPSRFGSASAGKWGTCCKMYCNVFSIFFKPLRTLRSFASFFFSK